MLDFEGTGPEVRNNLNTPIPVVHSAVIHCMRAMLDNDIPLNAGCLVPLTSEFYLRLPLPKLRDFVSQNSAGFVARPISNCRCLCRKCPDVSAHCGRCSQGIQCLRSESRVYEVRMSPTDRDRVDANVPSNLTFGAGGKGKDGAVSEGWGYYEVRLPAFVFEH